MLNTKHVLISLIEKIKLHLSVSYRLSFYIRRLGRTKNIVEEIVCTYDLFGYF